MLNLRYSLIGLIRHGLPGFLKLVDIRNAYIEITPAEPLPPEKERKPQQFKFPALFPDTLNLENINFIAHGPTGTKRTRSPGAISAGRGRPGSHRTASVRPIRCQPPGEGVG